jgi:sulfonate transport system substrate-binding protein
MTFRARLLLYIGLLLTPLGALGQGDPAVLRIGFQKSSADFVIAKQLHSLENRFPGSQVRWTEFPAGPQLLEAMAVGSVDVGMTGDSPPVFAQAAEKDLVYIGAEEPKPQSSAILVPRDSTIRTLADLKGKRIALQKGSSAHFLVVRAVAKAGIAWSDIQPIYLAPADARAAFERGSIDAWAIWDPYYAAAESAAKPRVLTTGEGLSNNNSFYLASRTFASANPQTVTALLDELSKTDAWTAEHHAEATRLLADYTGLDQATTERFLERRPSSTVKPLSRALIDDQQRVADAFLQLGLIPRAVRVADAVWPAGAR